MRPRIIFIFLFMVIPILLLIACDRGKIKEFGPLKLGEPALERPGDSTSYPYKNVPRSKFYIYVVEKGLPTMCVFDDCGTHGEVVECLGGWLSGDDREEVSDEVGLDGSNATSIIVVADQDSKIVGIYPNYTMQNIPEILKRHVDLIDFGSFAEKCPRGDQTLCCGCGYE
ncbi:hypothetical protein WDW89_00215 [Deltaproteobacteria bacterium TL4]